jgi:hypothetical protein
MPVFTEKMWSSLIFHGPDPDWSGPFWPTLQRYHFKEIHFWFFYQFLKVSFKKSKPFEYLGVFLRIGPKHPKTIAMESLISGPGYNSQWNKTSLSNLSVKSLFINPEWFRPFEKPFFMRRTLWHPYHWAVFISECHWCKIVSDSSYTQTVFFALVVRAPGHCIFVDKLLNIYIIYFVTVSQCLLRHPLTTVFRQHATGGCVCVEGFQCGSPLGLRKKDPPIIRVEIPTKPTQNCGIWAGIACHCLQQSPGT